MVIVFPAQDAETPAGNPLAPATPLFEIPVAPVVVWEKLVKAVEIQTGLIAGAAVTVLFGVTVMVPVALTAGVLHPPVRGME